VAVAIGRFAGQDEGATNNHHRGAGMHERQEGDGTVRARHPGDALSRQRQPGAAKTRYGRPIPPEPSPRHPAGRKRKTMQCREPAASQRRRTQWHAVASFVLEPPIPLLAFQCCGGANTTVVDEPFAASTCSGSSRPLIPARGDARSADPPASEHILGSTGRLRPLCPKR